MDFKLSEHLMRKSEYVDKALIGTTECDDNGPDKTRELLRTFASATLYRRTVPKLNYSFQYRDL